MKVPFATWLKAYCRVGPFFRICNWPTVPGPSKTHLADPSEGTARWKLCSVSLRKNPPAWNCWRGWDSPTKAISGPPRSPAENDSVWPSPAPCLPLPECFLPMNPLPAWIRIGPTASSVCSRKNKAKEKERWSASCMTSSKSNAMPPTSLPYRRKG